MSGPVSRPRLALVWCAFCAIFLISVYGIWSNALLKQIFWTPVGVRRFETVAVVYAMWCLIVIGIAPKWLAPVTSAVLLLSLAALWPMPVLAVLFFLISCYVTGAVLQPAATGLLQLLLGVTVWMGVVGGMAHFPVNYPIVYALLFLVPLAVKRDRTLACLRNCARLFRPLESARRIECALLALLGFAVICHLLVAIKPETGLDALAMHLVVPAWVDFQHSWHFDFRHLAWAVMPMGADWCYTAVYLLGGEVASRLLNFSFLVALVALLYGSCRQYAGRPWAFLLAALFASTPVVQQVTGWLFVENLWALLLLGAVVSLARFHATGEPSMLYLTAALLGAGMATKFGTLAFLVPMSAAAAWELVRSGKRLQTRLRLAALSLAILLLFGAVPYAFAYAKTGNPVFPFLNNIFKSPWFDVAPFITRYSVPLSLLAPYEAAFRTSKYLESYNGALGFHYLVFLALGIAALSRRWPYLGRLSFGVALVFSVLTFAGQAYVRYLYPAFPLLTVAAAAAISRLAAHRLLVRAFAGGFLLAFALNMYFLPSSGGSHPNFCLNPLKKREAFQYVHDYAPTRGIVLYLNRTHPGEPVALFQDGLIAGLKARAYVLGWHNRTYERQVLELTTADGYAKLVRSLGLKWFVVPMDRGRSPSHPPVREFLERQTELEYNFGSVSLLRLLPAAAGKHPADVERIAGPCNPGLIDDRAPRLKYSGAWRTMSRAGQACNGTLTSADSPDAEVTFRFSGTGVTYFFTRSARRGAAEITLDGARRDVVDLYSPGTEWRSRVTYSGLPPGEHAIAVRPLRAKATLSEAFDIDVDGFLVR